MSVPASVPRSLALACCIILAASQLPGIFSGVLFAWHPVLMSAGFLGLMTEGILRAVAFRNLEGLQRVRAIQRHGWIQGAASACISLGFAAIYANKVRPWRHDTAHWAARGLRGWELRGGWWAPRRCAMAPGFGRGPASALYTCVNEWAEVPAAAWLCTADVLTPAGVGSAPSTALSGAPAAWR